MGAWMKVNLSIAPLGFKSNKL
jgi:Ca2+-binding EF-hand superfamily protein